MDKLNEWIEQALIAYNWMGREPPPDRELVLMALAALAREDVPRAEARREAPGRGALGRTARAPQRHRPHTENPR